MKDTSAVWKEAERDARAHAIATQTVVPLRSSISESALSDDQRKVVALQTLERAVMQLEILGDDIADAEVMARLDHIEARLARRRFALRMRMGLVHLAGHFGRAP